MRRLAYYNGDIRQLSFDWSVSVSAYVISDVEIRDQELIKQYRVLAQDSIAQHGGRYLARGGTVEAVEGDWAPKGLIIVEFPDMERARAWYRSPEYAEALKMRRGALDRRLVFVGGVPPPKEPR
jgi:uncharacterized protein (DUF1330 family)